MLKKKLFVAAIIIAACVLGVLASLARRPDRRITTATDDYSLPSDDPQLGRRVYARCQACHGLQGEGVPGNYPPLAGSPLLAIDQAITLVLRGAQRGQQWNGQMPAFAEQLADHEIAAVLTWARQQWSSQAPAVTAADVAAHRN